MASLITKTITLKFDKKEKTFINPLYFIYGCVIMRAVKEAKELDEAIDRLNGKMK